MKKATNLLIDYQNELLSQYTNNDAGKHGSLENLKAKIDLISMAVKELDIAYTVKKKSLNK